MKLVPVTKIDKRNKTKSNAWSVKLTFSVIATFYLTKTENRTKKL